MTYWYKKVEALVPSTVVVDDFSSCEKIFYDSDLHNDGQKIHISGSEIPFEFNSTTTKGK